MTKEELINLNMKDVILNKWKSKLSYPLNHKDIEELENIIDYYEGLNQKYKEVIYKAINDIDLVIELIKQQPTEDDSWILYRLNGFKNILKDRKISLEV